MIRKMKRFLFFPVLLLITGLTVFEANSFSNIVHFVNTEVVSSSDSTALENEYFLVMRNSARYAEANTPDFGLRVIVAIEKLSVKSSKGKIKLNCGNVAVLLPQELYSLPKGEYFEVVFLQIHPPLQKLEKWIEPQTNIVVYENDKFRIFEERLAPGRYTRVTKPCAANCCQVKCGPIVQSRIQYSEKRNSRAPDSQYITICRTCGTCHNKQEYSHSPLQHCY